MTHANQTSNKVLLQGQTNKTRLWQENIFKINVEHTKSNGEFYFCLYLLGTWLKEVFKKTSNLHVAHMCSCVNYEWIKIQPKVKKDSIKNQLKIK